MNYSPIDKDFIKKDKSHNQKRVKLTIMCMLYKDDGSFLVLNRLKKDWPGLTFPGGHVEDNELIIEAVVREMKEETGLTVRNIEPRGYFEWNEFGDNVRHLAMLYRSKDFSGDLKESSEGNILWIKEEDLEKYPLSNDFEKILAKMR